MGAGQIGGIATLLDIDFNNAAGFHGEPAKITEGQFIVHYLSHAMMFCLGAIIESHVVLTPAICVYGETYKFKIFAGTHSFVENSGIGRQVQHLCIHKGYNHSMRWEGCSPDNLALICLNKPFVFNKREPYTEYILNRARYGVAINSENRIRDKSCRFYGWGSRRNDDLGSTLVCSGYVQGMMISRLIDRPCGVGFVDLSKYNRFLSCGVDDSRDVIDHDELMAFEFDHTSKLLNTPSLLTTPHENITSSPYP
ncbi:unnamed protein product [Danaus chrysippus]|uniref:(African queen) hypothetical protein n=1 Tax=Danaus chrysippus TaxID=151541 RepID=A0A8J2QPJ4_9NEOP|nr:unnamed protein product [Danaus chrysippus]